MFYITNPNLLANAETRMKALLVPLTLKGMPAHSKKTASIVQNEIISSSKAMNILESELRREPYKSDLGEPFGLTIGGFKTITGPLESRLVDFLEKIKLDRLAERFDKYALNTWQSQANELANILGNGKTSDAPNIDLNKIFGRQKDNTTLIELCEELLESKDEKFKSVIIHQFTPSVVLLMASLTSNKLQLVQSSTAIKMQKPEKTETQQSNLSNNELAQITVAERNRNILLGLGATAYTSEYYTQVDNNGFFVKQLSMPDKKQVSFQRK